MTDLKIMFWNIENVYDYKIVTPDELELEKRNNTKAEADKADNDSEIDMTKVKALENKAKKLFQQDGIEHRELVASIIKAVNPDIVVLVELSVGRTDLVNSGQVPEGKTGRIKNAFIEFDHWGPRQYQVSLNDLYDKERWWASAISQVNCSNLVPGLNNAGQLQFEHKNTMFELYGLLWDTKKVDLVGDFRVTDRRARGKLNFFERNPGVARFQEVGSSRKQFLLVMIHSGYFGNPTEDNGVLKKRGKIISNLMYLNDVDRAINGPKFSPVVVAGDFNLDYGGQTEKGYYKPFEQQDFKARINGKTTLGKINKTFPNSYTRNAYDNIFTRGFTNDASPGGIKDFVKDEFQVPEPSKEHSQKIEKALKISNHLPVYATVRF